MVGYLNRIFKIKSPLSVLFRNMKWTLGKLFNNQKRNFSNCFMYSKISRRCFEQKITSSCWLQKCKRNSSKWCSKYCFKTNLWWMANDLVCFLFWNKFIKEDSNSLPDFLSEEFLQEKWATQSLKPNSIQKHLMLCLLKGPNLLKPKFHFQTNFKS